MITREEQGLADLESVFRTQGKAEGIAEGKTVGIVQGKAEVAENLLRLGFSPEVIKESTGLSLADIQNRRLLTSDSSA